MTKAELQQLIDHYQENKGVFRKLQAWLNSDNTVLAVIDQWLLRQDIQTIDDESVIPLEHLTELQQLLQDDYKRLSSGSSAEIKQQLDQLVESHAMNLCAALSELNDSFSLSEKILVVIYHAASLSIAKQNECSNTYAGRLSPLIVSAAEPMPARDRIDSGTLTSESSIPSVVTTPAGSPSLAASSLGTLSPQIVYMNGEQTRPQVQRSSTVYAGTGKNIRSSHLQGFNWLALAEEMRMSRVHTKSVLDLLKRPIEEGNTHPDILASNNDRPFNDEWASTQISAEERALLDALDNKPVAEGAVESVSVTEGGGIVTEDGELSATIDIEDASSITGDDVEPSTPIACKRLGRVAKVSELEFEPCSPDLASGMSPMFNM